MLRAQSDTLPVIGVQKYLFAFQKPLQVDLIVVLSLSNVSAHFRLRTIVVVVVLILFSYRYHTQAKRIVMDLL